MNTRATQIFRKFFGLFTAIAIVGVFCFGAQAATLSPKLQNQIGTLADDASVGMTIVAFHTANGLQESHLNVLRSAGVTGGQTFPLLGMVAQPMTAGQVRALAGNSAVRSIWSNDPLQYYMHQARVLGGVQKLQTDSAMTTRNGGMPVTGAGDFSVLVIDSGIDATHADLPFGSKVVQNVHPVLATSTVRGFTPNLTIENIQNTDETVGHGTHCAGIVGGTGVRSGGLYTGVAPGAKIVGAGLGAGILVVNPLGAWEWGLANQYRYNIRVVTNSYGPLGGGEFNADHPITIASQMGYERNMTILFAGGNDGAAKDTLSPYAQAPWVIGVAAGTKEGTLADFSSRGTPRAERLSDNNPKNDNDAPTLTAPGTGRAFASNATKFTTDIVSVRSMLNLTSNGTTADTELPVGMVPFYTQISGTSMATPFAAGVVALMLDADPTLTPDEIKQILVDTASKMPGYEDYEVGAGYINAYAAVDKVFNRSKNYAKIQDATYNAVFGEERPAQQTFNLNFNPAVSGPTSQNATTFTVAPDMNILDVSATVDTAAEEGTGNLVGIRLTAPNGTFYSTAIDFPVIGSNKRQIVVPNPQAGTWTLEVRGARGLTAVQAASSPIQIAAPGPVEGTVTQVKFILPNIPDIAGHPQQSAIEAAIKSRLIDTYSDGNFRPDAIVTREDLARSLLLNTSVRQSLGAAPKFTDVSGDLQRITEAITANGSTLRDWNFVPKGMVSATAPTFNPTGTVNRLDLAVAFVRALGHDALARSKANQTVMVGGQALSDNAQIPGELRGYVQLAIYTGLFEAFPAQVIQTGPGQFQVLPGPRFEPNTTVTRATLAARLNSFRQLFTTGG
ncbi:MAG TPA: S8 family serine peptidase [Pyrinomonadaceae bacterium]|nr:S8 family serine peptidase [Pyrinomonadaceae bacterium]